jgi:hypothetical protein
VDVLRVTYAAHHRPMGQFFLCGFCGCVFRMEWTQERVIEVIDAYEKKRIIWDPNIRRTTIKYERIKYSNSVGDILVKFLYNPLTD